MKERKKFNPPALFDQNENSDAESEPVQKMEVGGSDETESTTVYKEVTKTKSKKMKEHKKFRQAAVCEQNEDENVALRNDSEENVETNVQNETESFMILGEIKETKLKKVSRILPDWLTNPTIITVDLKSKLAAIDEIPMLKEHLTYTLQKNNITSFFPVQREVIPVLLKDVQNSWIRSRDICVSAPTGSGKTLAFVLPIVQALLDSKIHALQALIVLPHQNLAEQVCNVFQTFCQGTNLKVGLATAKLQFLSEQKQLIQESTANIHQEIKYYSKVDILVVTPGRLVDHILKTPGFNLEYLRFLVIDEADTLMDFRDLNWVKVVESTVCKNKPYPKVITAESICNLQPVPFQKLLFSATLSQNPEKLEQLNLFLPRLFTSNTSVICNSQVPADLEVKFIGKFATPQELTEHFVLCKKSDKPLLLLHLLHNLKYHRVLCFTNSKDTTMRLFRLLDLFGSLNVGQFSATLASERRSAILKQFTSGKTDILICSDLAARGMDLPEVDYVISYDKPSHIRNYIHRVGRTARAGREGTAVIFLTEKEKQSFENQLQSINKPNFDELPISEEDMNKLLPDYEEALQKLAEEMKA